MLVIEVALGVALGILLAAGLRKLLPRVQWRRIADRMYGLPTNRPFARASRGLDGSEQRGRSPAYRQL
jgi:hypothetical protein